MPRMVFCKKYQAELEGLEAPPMSTKRGQDIFENVSQKALEEWQELQTMLINERHLNLIDPESRTYLTRQMDRFMNNEPVDHAEGYIPPDQRI